MYMVVISIKVLTIPLVWTFKQVHRQERVRKAAGLELLKWGNNLNLGE